MEMAWKKYLQRATTNTGSGKAPRLVLLFLTSQKLGAQVVQLEAEPAPLQVEIQDLVKLSTAPHAA